MSHIRDLWLDEIKENLSYVDDDDLEKVNEAVILLGGLLPPWLDKCVMANEVEDQLIDSLNLMPRWVNEPFVP